MQTKWIIVAAAFLLSAPLAYAAPVDGGSGVAAIVTFDANGATFQEAPGWDCTFDHATDGTVVTVVSDCVPEPLLAARFAGSAACKDARAVVGASPVSLGYLKATVACGGGSASCENNIIGFGQCVATLEGTWTGNLVCTAVTDIISVGGTGYSTCSNGQ